jgi:hypothetical protein
MSAGGPGSGGRLGGSKVTLVPQEGTQSYLWVPSAPGRGPEYGGVLAGHGKNQKWR